ncbi:hypothetical protein CTAYLR_005992 [Chrysophaeum taylorii]|uniref:Glycosyl transferase 64 domain-containing protein n=1 Tax=Chrysophaeum taylorii TaxID=2483200 RepID=A0AAD7XEJ4_9STRA|nr:hypothetical protein CTAYLR_005992 [Chrysophaeum taylorii]
MLLGLLGLGLAAEQVTICVMTYRRVEVLASNPILLTIVPSASVRELLIIWNDVEDRKGIGFLKRKFEALGIQGKVANFHFGFAWWRQDPFRIVGFTPRLITYNASTRLFDYFSHYPWSSIRQNVEHVGYNMALCAGGIFVHSKYLHAYGSNIPAMIRSRKLVDSKFNCDDILINWIVPHEHQPPRIVQEYDLTADSMSVLKERPPATFLFCETHIKKAVRWLDAAWLKRKGTKLAAWSDDSNVFNGFERVQLKLLLGFIDVVLSPSAYMLREYFSSLNVSSLPVILWIPHGASPAFTEQPYNRHPMRKLLLWGSVGQASYTIREWLITEFQPKHRSTVDLFKHMDYRARTESKGSIHAELLSAYYCGIATTTIHRRMVAKIFEIPATGALLLVNNDLQPMLSALGLTNMIHYVAFDGADPAPMIEWTLDPRNFAAVDEIRNRGMLVDRSQAVDDYFRLGSEHHPLGDLDAFAKSPPCPMTGYRDTRMCVDDYWRRVAHYYHSTRKDHAKFERLRAKTSANE